MVVKGRRVFPRFDDFIQTEHQRISTFGKFLFGGVVAQFELFALDENLKECRIFFRDPSAEYVPSDEHRDTGQDAVEDVEQADCANANDEEKGALNSQISEGLMQAFVDAVDSFVIRFLHRPPVVCLSVGSGWLQLHSPEPRKNVHGENRNPGPGCDTGEIFLRARITMRESESTHHDGYKTGDFRNGSGEERLDGRETAIQWLTSWACARADTIASPMT